MDEILKITEKYDEAFIKEGLGSVEALNKFALTFYKDVAEIYDCITRIRNIERNPRGFSLNDAPILGLLVRVWKLLKEVIYYYGENNAEIIGILERPLIEAAVVAQYLMTSDQSIVEDYRKCSYKDRLRLLLNLQTARHFMTPKQGSDSSSRCGQRWNSKNSLCRTSRSKRRTAGKFRGKASMTFLPKWSMSIYIRQRMAPCLSQSTTRGMSRWISVLIRMTTGRS
jgi:hypothetical protein